MPGEIVVPIGHITNDLEPTNHLGGGVSYSAIAASRLGAEAHIITKCPPSHPYARQLRGMGITVHVLPSPSPATTSFRNIYEDTGRRQQVTEQQEPITLADLRFMPEGLLYGASILVAPVIGEVDLGLFRELARYGNVSVTPQGYFRDISPSGIVSQKPWSGFENALAHTQVAVLSDEDIRINNKVDSRLLREMQQACKTVVLTRGRQGATIYSQDKQRVNIGAFHLQDSEIRDLTGAGDTFATALLVGLSRGLKVEEAAVNANFFAALKLLGTNGIGIDSIPTIEQVTNFRGQNPKRVSEFLERAGINRLALFD